MRSIMLDDHALDAILNGEKRLPDYPAIVRAILADYALHPEGYHGVYHWARVSENGQRLATALSADTEVVRLFALFHDARRFNEDDDPEHGKRGGDLAWSLRGSLVHCTDAQFDQLYFACEWHTRGHETADPTVMACWDADRLDLGRVGIVPAPHRLSTDAARALLPWAHRRTERGHVAEHTVLAWGWNHG